MKTLPEVLTFGCRLNIAESETMRRHAAAAGLHDAIIVNTCAVTAEAERQAGQAIRRVRRENPNVKIIVTGCSSQINPQKYAAMREVDCVIPNDKKLQAESFSALKAANPPPASPTLGTLFHIAGEGEKQRAFVEVQNGCDNKCTFCIIPFGRGASRSVSFEDVTAQVRAHVEAGFNEIVLTGVDIASYGRDLPGEPTLGFMVRRVLAEVPDLRRLRLSSLDPAAIDEDLWEAIEEDPRLMPHVHLSLQSGDDMILKRMKRRHSRDDVFRLIERARKVRPDIVFGADIIAGFPTETEDMFKNTFDLALQGGLTWLHVFPYSSRKGTPASKMPQVHGSLRKERADRLRLFGEKAARRHYESLVGTTVKVLVENNGIGCTPQFAKVKLLGPQPVGRIVDARCLRMEKDVVVAEVGKAA
jgi:threonylcarbamoyladenosine tRNA methylthiotransferase MtaB